MSTSKCNFTREVLLERERGKAGASWLAGGQYADHVVVSGSLRSACVDSAPVRNFYLFFLNVRGTWASPWFLWERRASEGGLLMSACAVSVSSSSTCTCLFQDCSQTVSSTRPQHMYRAWEMIIKAHHPKAGGQTAKWYRPNISNVSVMGLFW